VGTSLAGIIICLNSGGYLNPVPPAQVKTAPTYLLYNFSTLYAPSIFPRYNPPV